MEEENLISKHCALVHSCSRLVPCQSYQGSHIDCQNNKGDIYYDKCKLHNIFLNIPLIRAPASYATLREGMYTYFY
jgi:hypothetical protein